MTTRSHSLLRDAFALLSVRMFLQQIGLALAVSLLCVLWLRIPDASLLEVLGSACLALLVIWVAGAGESALMLRLVDSPRTWKRLLRGALLVVAGIVMWFGWSMLLGHLRGDYNSNDSLWAGYLNSRFPHGLRPFFSYQHLLLWLRWMWTATSCVGTAVITALVFAGTTTTRPLRAVGYAMRCVAYWCIVVPAAIVASMLTGELVGWTPGHGLRVEMISVLLRLAAIVALDTMVVCFGLALLAACVRRSDAVDMPQSVPAGTPDASQPRTAEAP